MAFHSPFRSNIQQASQMKIGDVILCDDSEMTIKDFRQLIFNLLRLFVFNPIPLRRFCTLHLTDLKYKMKENVKRDFWNYNITFEIVETLQHTSEEYLDLPVLSRFVNISDLEKFVEDNNMLHAAEEQYGIRLIVAHIVSDCFLYVVQGEEVFKTPSKTVRMTRFPIGPSPTDLDTSLMAPTGNVVLRPLSYFSCRSTQLAATNQDNMYPVARHIPNKIQDAFPSSMLAMQEECSLVWLPTMQSISVTDIPLLLQEAYNFQDEFPDLLFENAKNNGEEEDLLQEKLAEDEEFV